MILPKGFFSASKAGWGMKGQAGSAETEHLQEQKRVREKNVPALTPQVGQLRWGLYSVLEVSRGIRPQLSTAVMCS